MLLEKRKVNVFVEVLCVVLVSLERLPKSQKKESFQFVGVSEILEICTLKRG